MTALNAPAAPPAILLRAETLIFDLDGTLTDPKRGITGCFQYALAQMGEPVPEADALTWTIGPPLRDSFVRIVGEARADEGVAQYRKRYGVEGLFENTLIPGIPEVLAVFHGRARLMVATSKVELYARRILDHFDLTRWFDGIYGSEMDGTRAHKPDLLAHLLVDAGVDPARAVMIGDRTHDAIGARSVGMRAVGVAWGYGDATELAGAGFDAVALVPADLTRIIVAGH